MFTAFGLTFPEQPTELELHLACFLHNPKPEDGGLGKAEHFWKIVGIIWGPQNKVKSFERNPWTERMMAAACEHQYLGLSGCASSGKTEFAAVWAIVNWMCSPHNTLVFCTSTDLKNSSRRIWGRIKKFWEAAPGLPGKLVDSYYLIRTDNGSGVFSDEQGIACIAGEKKNEKDCVGKLIGAHPDRLILIVDEMPEITEAILTAALSNMAINPFFQMIGVGNFKSLYDTFGVFVRPKEGYGAITVEDEEWETELGWCLRFDGMKSPNITEGEDKYECYDSKNLATHRKNHGDDSAEFWRMCRSFPAPLGTVDVLYSDADFLTGRSNESVPCGDLSWLGPRTRISSLDPSYTNGGDRSVQWFGWWGVLTNGVWALCYDRHILLRDRVGDKAPRDYQIVRQFRDNCLNENVAPENAAFDGTAASGFASIVFEEWSPKVMKVEFGGGASDMRVAVNDQRTAKEMYDRRVSELWGVGREFVRAGQLKGVPPDMCRELKARRYETMKRGGNVLISVEPKQKMKARIGFSPDLADAAFVLLELCRRRFGALAGGVSTGMARSRSDFFKIAAQKDRVYQELYAEAVA